MLTNFKKIVLFPRTTAKQIKFFWILLGEKSQEDAAEALRFLEEHKPDLARELARSSCASH